VVSVKVMAARKEGSSFFEEKEAKDFYPQERWVQF
jgi:hypothetical protein